MPLPKKRRVFCTRKDFLRCLHNDYRVKQIARCNFRKTSSLRRTKTRDFHRSDSKYYNSGGSKNSVVTLYGIKSNISMLPGNNISCLIVLNLVIMESGSGS